ncbi:MAG: TIGR00730 family Rossman fold protein [Lachnospiraceae bacterium]|nr:TIGR00730 family Rossman fold protein [Lachnospiraceae bacterium]
MNIVVYLGANEGNDPEFTQRICELGKWIGESGHTLVYGGSKSGLMGHVAESTLDAGGKVIGVEPQMFIDAGYLYDRIDELIITEDITKRKSKMIELGDAFIAFPGGTGTLDEISEIMGMVVLKQTTAPCIIYNIGGYYDGIKSLLDNMVRKNLANPEKLKGIIFAENLEEIKEVIA